jgi:hypothetical protein
VVRGAVGYRLLTLGVVGCAFVVVFHGIDLDQEDHVDRLVVHLSMRCSYVGRRASIGR